MTFERLQELVEQARRTTVPIWLVRKYDGRKSIQEMRLDSRSRIYDEPMSPSRKPWLQLSYPDSLMTNLSLLDHNVFPNHYNEHQIFDNEEEARAYFES